jgi:hypothetical protein
LLATLGVTNPDSQRSLDASAACTAASRAIDNLCQRRFYADSDTAQVRYYGPADTPVRLQIDDLITLTSLKTRDDGGNVDTADSGLQTWTVNTDFVTGPLNAAQNSADVWPWTRLEVIPTGSYTFNRLYPRSVKVTGKFGWPSVPGPIADATTLLAERIYKMKREAPLGTIAIADMAVHIARADSNIMILVAPYMRYPSVVA